jgi:MFS family permease
MDAHFGRNVLGVSLVEFLWGLGMPTVIESTFLQLLMRQMGASSLLLGLIPTLAALGTAGSGLLSYTLTAHLRRKRTAVIAVHVATALPMLEFGVVLHFTGFAPGTLPLFLVLFAFFSVAVGLILPVWQNYLMKIFSARKAVPAMAVMMTAQSVTKVLGSLFLVRVVERFAFSAEGASLVFVVVGATFLVGSFPFLLTVEEPLDADGPQPAAPAGPDVPVAAAAPRPTIGELLRNRRFMLFLGTELEYYALAVVIAFYASYAAEFHGIDRALASGLFMAFTYGGGVLANVLLGWLDLFSSRGKYLLTKSPAIGGVLLMALHPVPWTFYLASLLMGASRGTRMVVYMPEVKRRSGHADATLHFAVAPILALPFSTGLPLLAGAFLDSSAALGAAAYRIVFVALAGIGLAGLAFTARMHRD